MPKYRSMPVYRPVGTKKPAHFCAGRLFRKGLQANDIDLTPRLFGKIIPGEQLQHLGEPFPR